MGKVFIKSIVLLLILTLLCSVTGCGKEKSGLTVQKYSQNTDYASLDDGIITENAGFILKWVNTLKRIVLVDKKSGAVWSSTPDESLNNKDTHVGVNSPIAIEYVDEKNVCSQITYAMDASIENGTVSCEEVDNGICVTYYFPAQEISVPVEYKLCETGINISVVTQNITENKNRLFRISIAPFFCGLSNTADRNSYLFIPSGSGALVYPKELSRMGETVEENVYGDDLMVEVRQNRSDADQVLLPVFGVKKEKRAALAIIDGGAESAMLRSHIGSKATGYSTVYPTFQVRGYADSVAKLYSYRTQTYVYDDELIDTTLSVTYHILSEEQASYSGFAEYYREYLKNSEGFKKSEEEEALINLRFIGGINSQDYFLGIPYNKFYSLTTLSEAEKITKELNSLTDGGTSVELTGYGQSGYDIEKLAGGYTVSSKLGGVKQLKKFNAFCKENNISAYFTTNLAEYRKSADGWSRVGDAALGINEQTVYQVYYDRALGSVNTEVPGYIMLSRTRLSDSVEKFLDKTSSWGLNGVGLGTLSYSAWSDFKFKEYEVKGRTEKQITELAEKISKRELSVLASGANAYAAASADRISEAPSGSSRATVFDEDIPFYQMVFKGLKPISGAAVNYSEDMRKEILMAAETGTGLGYTLINSYDDVLVNSYYNRLNLSVYGGLKSEIESSIKELETLFFTVRGNEITNHTILENGLRVTEFSNGTKVYVNYTKDVLTADNNIIPAEGFVLKEAIE